MRDAMVHAVRGAGVAIVWVLAGTANSAETGQPNRLRAVLDEAAGTISVYRGDQETPVVTQVARPDFRPFLHPIVAPDGQGVLTENRPGHHRHQTGLYWGFTRVNGRDYFHHPESSHWRRVSLSVLKGQADRAGEAVQWQTVYDLLDGDEKPILRESQIWSLGLEQNDLVLDLDWTGDALVDVTVGQYDYGGLFLRMPWRKGMPARVVNSARQQDRRAEGQRAVWVDVAMQVEGRDDPVHVAVFDHPNNPGFPQPWRVDGQFGVGPVRARLGDWQIEAGKSVGFRHRLIAYTGEFSDLELTERWSEFSGQPRTWAQWNLARQEGREAKFLTPEAAVSEMTVGDEFQVNVFAAEPMITQPMAFCWDDRGRLWIAENRDYEDRRTGFSGSGDSRIVILEDSDRDGTADRRKVFCEGIPFPSAVAVGMGGLWLGAPPNLLFLPDRDGDDRADLDAAEVRLTGWGIRDRHETLNSFHWGPDGWLYGLQGFATPSRVGKPAGRGRIYRPGEPYPDEIEFAGPTEEINGGVWRYHPTKDRFEVVAHGFSNPWGIDYDARGQLFITACVIPHLWHVIPGGIYHRQGGTHFNPHVYDDIKTIADHRHRSAHGGARIYLSDAFPPRYRDQIFMANIHEHAVLTDVLERRGSGFVGRHGEDFLLANNAQWVGFSVEIGPEGAVYVLDWHDADICGSDVLHKETGRVFRITPKQSHAVNFDHRDADLAALSDTELVDLQRVDSAWHARRARVILQHRAAKGTLDPEARKQLRRMFRASTETDRRLRALWGLHVTGGAGEATLTAALEDPDEYVRAWSIQLLCEDGTPTSSVVSRMNEMAAVDPSPVVRLYLASALSRVAEPVRWEWLQRLVQHGKDAGDHNLPKMLWFGLEPLVVKDPSRALELAVSTEIPVITRHVARRLSDDGQLDRVLAAVVAAAGAGVRYGNGVAGPHRSEYGTHKATQLLLGMRDSLDGQFDLGRPKDWGRAVEAIGAIGEPAQRVMTDLGQRFGDPRATERLLSVAQDGGQPLARRREAIASLAAQQHPKLLSALPRLLEDPATRVEAIRATANYESEKLTELLLDRYGSLSADERLEAVLALASRSGSGRALTEAIAEGRVPRRDVPAYVARLLHRVVGTGFVEVWGPIESLDADRRALLAKYRALLTEDALAQADLGRGKEWFRRTCSACHRLHGEGGTVGPDITGANRGNLEYLLGNILTPSAEIQDAYRMQIVLTEDGRVYSGIPVEENERQLKLRVANQEEPVTIAQASIESRQVAQASMMPDGLLNELTDAEVIDLVAYLQSRQ